MSLGAGVRCPDCYSSCSGPFAPTCQTLEKLFYFLMFLISPCLYCLFKSEVSQAETETIDPDPWLLAHNQGANKYIVLVNSTHKHQQKFRWQNNPYILHWINNMLKECKENQITSLYLRKLCSRNKNKATVKILNL